MGSSFKTILLEVIIIFSLLIFVIWILKGGCNKPVPEIKPDTHVTDSLGEEIVKRETKIKADSVVKIVLQKHSDSLETLIKIARQKMNQKAKENDDLNAEYADAVQKADTAKILTDCDSIQKMNAVGALMIRDYADITDSLIKAQHQKDSICNAESTLANQQSFDFQLLHQKDETTIAQYQKSDKALRKEVKAANILEKVLGVLTAGGTLYAIFKK